MKVLLHVWGHCPPLTWSLWLGGMAGLCLAKSGSRVHPGGKGSRQLHLNCMDLRWERTVSEGRSCAVMSRGDWMETRDLANVHHPVSTPFFSPYLTVCDFERFSTKFPLNVSKKVLMDLSFRKFSPEGSPQKIPLRLLWRFPEGPPTCFLRRFSLEIPSFPSKISSEISLSSFPSEVLKMFPLKSSLQKFSLRRFP